jgi:hypothetical protein
MARGPARGLADVGVASVALSDNDGQAHVIEHADNRLIRPDSEYIEECGQRRVPLGAR